MTNSNKDLNDTITLSNTMYQDYSIPAYTTDSFSSYLNSISITGSDAVCGSHSAGDTITLPGGYTSLSGSPYYSSTTNGLSNSYYNTTTIGSGTWNHTEWSSSYGTPFVDKFPEWNAFRKLCEDYPGLEKAYENLKTFYTMCYADSLLPKEDK